MYLHKWPHYIDAVWNVNADRMQSCAGCVQRKTGFMRRYEVIFYGHVFHKVVNVASEGLNLWRCGSSWLLIRIQQSKGRANDARSMIMLSKMLKNKGRVITYQTTVPFESKSIVAGWKNTLKLNISTTLYDFWWWNAFRKLKNTQKREG